jgi:type II secretion system protein H
MPTLAPGCSECAGRWTGHRGFTLLELLVALVIIAVGISAVVISLRPDTRGIVREEGNRLAALLALASEQSVLEGRPLAWIGREDGYEFQARELTDSGPEWSAVRGDDLLQPRQFPVGTRILSIQADGQLRELGQRVTLGSQGAHDMTVEIALGETRARITGTAGHFESVLSARNGT